MNKEKAAYLSEVLKAYSEGKKIEVSLKGRNSWMEDSYDLNFDFYTYEYRIMKEPKYRPYKSAEEFLIAQKEHGPMIKSKMGNYLSITEVSHRGAWFSDMDICHYENMVNNYCWQDGTPCGIIDEE